MSTFIVPGKINYIETTSSNPNFDANIHMENGEVITLTFGNDVQLNNFICKLYEYGINFVTEHSV